MHPILEIAIGVALGMTVFIVFAWVIGMCVYVACSKNDCIASCKKTKKFKGTKNISSVSASIEAKAEDVVPKVYQVENTALDSIEAETKTEVEAIKENQTS
jgi:hypothetical protein